MNNYGLNPDIRTRDEIIFGNYDPSAYLGGTCRFNDMDYNTLNTLVSMGFASEDERQNFAPSIGEMLEFASSDPEAYYFDGYAVSANRSDYRVSIDAIHRDAPFADQYEMDAFIDFCSEADERDWSMDGGYAWWD